MATTDDPLDLPGPAFERVFELLSNPVPLVLCSHRHYFQLAGLPAVRTFVEHTCFFRRFLWPSLKFEAGYYFYWRTPNSDGELELELYAIPDEFSHQRDRLVLVANIWLIGAPLSAAAPLVEAVPGAWLSPEADALVVRGFQIDLHALLLFLRNADTLNEAHIYVPEGPPYEALRSLNIPVDHDSWASLSAADFWRFVEHAGAAAG